MSVSAVIVTRGNVDLRPVLDSLPEHWEQVIWDNKRRRVEVRKSGAHDYAEDRVTVGQRVGGQPNLAVYGRFTAIAYATRDLIYVQDDDAILVDPPGVIWTWETEGRHDRQALVANMPERFRPHYPDSALIGFGACFDRNLPQRIFERWFEAYPDHSPGGKHDAQFLRCCDVIFTTLVGRRVLCDIEHRDREFASDPDRMWRQRDHVSERAEILAMSRALRDGATP